MAEHILQTLDLVKGQIRDLEAELSEKKRMANSLCELAGAPALYAVTEASEKAALLPSRGDEYYGKTMSPAIRLVLEARQAAGLGPAPVNEIHEALKAGGYQFDAASEANEKKSVRICLTKNSSIFHKLPSGGKYGLLKWYPRVKTPKSTNGNGRDEQEGRATMDKEFGANRANEDETVKSTDTE